jgi:hypothetical protein
MRLLSAVFAGLMVSAGSAARAQSPDSTSMAITAAQLAAVTWLSLVDQGRYGESWDSAATVFRQSVTKPSWEAAVGSARRPFEPLGERQQLGASFHTKLPNAPPGQYVVLQYRTKTGGEKAVVETVTPMKDSDGVWRVSGYYVRPE